MNFFNPRRNGSQFVLAGCSVLFLFIIFSLPKALSHVHKAPSLLIVSFDGFRWNYLNRTKTPNFDRVIKAGVWARKGLKNVFTTSTLTNHWSIVTGLYAESHGIIENEMFDPVLNASYVPLYKDRFYHNDPRFYDVPGVMPIWVLNQMQNEHGRSGSVMWWGAENTVNFVRPTYHMSLNPEISGIEKIDTMMKWFTQKYPINLGLLYFSEPDHVAHKFGPDSVNVEKEIAHADELTGYLLEQLKKFDLFDDVNLIITSDHGFASSSQDRLIMLDEYVDTSWFRVVHYTPVCTIIPQSGYEDKVYEALKKAAPGNHFRVFKKAEIPEDLHYKNNVRVTPIIAIADLSWNFMVNMTKDKFKLKGVHGYDNSNEDMHPFFMAMGPSFKSGYQLDTFNSVDIYSLMCHLLHLTPGPHNGTMNVVSEFLGGEHETSIWTFSTYIICLIIIASVGGVYVVAACRQHRYLKRKLSQLRMSTIGSSKSNLVSSNGARVRLLSDEEDAEDEEF